jgi:hypothetical protein
MKKQLILSIWCIIIVILLALPAMSGQYHQRPKFKMIVSTNFSSHSIGQLTGIDWLGIYVDQPVSVDALNDLSGGIDQNRSGHSDYSGQVGLGYNFIGPWYLIGGVQYEKWDETKNKVVTQGNWTGIAGHAYFKAITVIPFVAIEYSNKIWGINYNSSIGLAECISRVNVSYVNLINDHGDLGKYSYNSPGMIFSGGLSYELVRDVYINGQLGYRFFSGKHIEAPARYDSPDIDFDYNGAFYGIGMGYGFGGR